MTNKSSAFKWLVLFAMVFGSAILNYSNMIFASRPADVMALYNMNQAQLTAISTIGMVPGALFSIFLGRFFDKHGARAIRFVGAGMLFLGALCQVWRIFAGSYIEVFIITFLVGTFFLPTQVIPAKVIGLWFDRSENALAMAIFGAAAGIGITLTFAVGNLFSSTPLALASCAAGFFAASVFWLAFAVLPRVESDSEENNVGDSGAVHGETSFKSVLTSKTMLLIMICSAFGAGAPLFLNSYLINAFIDKGMSSAGTSLLGVVFNICLVLGAVISGAIAAKSGRFNRLYLFVGVAGGVFLLLTYLVPVGPLTFVCLGIAGLLISGTLALNMGRIALIPLTGDFGPQNIGTAGGMNNTAMGLGMFVIPSVAAVIVGSNYLAVFVTVLVFFVAIGLIGGIAMPELGERGKLATAARGFSACEER